MNNCRAGLYSFVSTTTWLHETGMASPPFLVMLGLTLPDSRILSGIASIGLTLANIAVILPHLRQGILDSMHAHECALADEQNTQEQINSSDGSNAIQPNDLNVKSPSHPSVSPCDRGHQSPPLACSTTVKSASVATESLECLDFDSEFASQAILLLPVKKTSEIPSQICRSPDDGKHVSSRHLLARGGRSPLHIPLPTPDAAEVAFFDTTCVGLSNRGLGKQYPTPACERPTAAEEHSTEIRGPITGKGIEQGGSSVGRQGNLMVTSGQPIANENVSPIPTKVTVRDHHNPMAERTASRLPDDLAVRGGNAQRDQTEHSLKEVLTKRRPESLEFIPQSVIRRYPSAPMAPAGRCLGHRTFISGHGHPVTSTSSHIFVDNPAMLLDGTRPRASYTTLEGYGRTSFLTEVHPRRRSMEGRTFVFETALAQDPLEQGPASLPEPPTIHELISLRKYPTHRRRLGVLARAAIRSRRSISRRCRNDAIDGSSTSDSDSEWDSDSQYSSRSSADENMLPHILGTDLIAAIDANSESELNLVGSRRKMHSPLNVYGDLLVSESTADVSMVMHVSSIGDASDGEVRAPATFRPLTYEDIQQWASGVVQKCVRQVRRSRAPVEPLSPSQASDVCAERPSGLGISKCPLSDFHRKFGAVALAEGPAPEIRELPVPLPLAPTSILPTRKPLSIRNLHGIPEFVPRQRHVSVITGREGPGLDMRSTVDATRDAATEVIARMESQAKINTRRRLVGMDEKRTADGWQGTLRWA